MMMMMMMDGRCFINVLTFYLHFKALALTYIAQPATISIVYRQWHQMVGD